MAGKDQLAKNWDKIPAPGSYAGLYADYGNPFTDPQFEAKYITGSLFQLASGHSVNVRHHIAISVKLRLIWHMLIQTHNICLVESYDGCYVVRSIRGSDHPSIHSWGLAIDLNAQSYPLGSHKQQATVLVHSFQAQGFAYGGDFHHRKDPMHFQFASADI